jgi:predicted NUDIX family NTP pyrophosphohydrolase
MAKQAAGILPFRRRNGQIEVLLLHLAGPFWAHKDTWHFPKGELEEGEDWLEAARREFHEEIGVPLPDGELIDLKEGKQGKKTNSIWAIENDVDLSHFPDTLKDNVFDMEWPPKSGQTQTFPENDRAEWFTLQAARGKVFAGLVVFLDRLAEHLGVDVTGEPESEQQSLL